MIICLPDSASPPCDHASLPFSGALIAVHKDIQSLSAGVGDLPCVFVSAGPISETESRKIVRALERPLIGILTSDVLTIYPLRVEGGPQRPLICVECLRRRTAGDSAAPTNLSAEIRVHELARPFADAIERYDGLLWHPDHLFCPGIEIGLDDCACRFISLLPMPDCKTCHLPEKPPAPQFEQNLLALTPSLIHRPGGILKASSAHRVILRGVEGPLWIGKVLTAVHPGGKIMVGSGRGFSATEALMGALGEAIEIYTACSDFETGGLPGPGVSPSPPEQNSSHRPTTTTSGCAVHTDRRLAIEAAFRELVERDAFLVSWYSRQVRCHYKILQHPDQNTLSLARFLNDAGYEIVCAALPTDFGLEVVQIILWHENVGIDLPYTVCGLGTGLTATQAATRALMEAAQIIPAVSFHAANFNSKPETEWGPEDHGGYYGSALRRAALQHLLTVQHVECFTPPNDMPFFIHEMSTAAGVKAYLEDLTTAELKLLGISSVRVRIPHLLQLCFGAGVDPAKVDERTCAVLQSSNARNDINPWPHPLT